MNRIKGLKISALLSILLILGLILGPNLKWLNPARWWGESLLVLMNENEARPCGGFVTAFGVLNMPFGGMELNNSFAFPPVDLGLSPAPLDRVSVEQKFWDLGASAKLNRCGQEFLSAYERATGRFPDRVILVQSSVIENFLTALGPVKAGELELSGQNFFVLTSRLVADIDRHDEKALSERKEPLNVFGKKLALSTLLRPWQWRGLSQSLHEAETNGALYLHRPGESKEPTWQRFADKTISVSEWNLGGGKSSRYLDKLWTVQLNQVSQTQWELIHNLTVTHLGGQDKPLSQTWQGGFELKSLKQPSRFVSATINPGETFTHTEAFWVSTTDLQLVLSDQPPSFAFNLYAPPYQNWQTRLQVRALGQQIVRANTSNLSSQENTARWHGANNLDGESFSFSLQPDTIPPFLTWHKPLLNPEPLVSERLDLNERFRVVELHFNEPVVLPEPPTQEFPDGVRFWNDVSAWVSLKDRDYAVPDIKQDLQVSSALLLADKTTLLLKVEPVTYQTNERYNLTFNRLQDVWGNEAQIDRRTVITR